MRILRIIPTINPKSGGPVEGARRIDAELLRTGHEVEVASLDDPGHEYLNAYPTQVNALGPSVFGYQYNPRLTPWLKANVRRFDAVIINGIWQYHAFGAWRALKGGGTPYVVFTHGMLDPWFKKKYPLKHLKKWLYWPWADFRVLRDASRVIFTSHEEMVSSRQSFWLYRCKEVVTSYGTSAPPPDADRLQEAFIASRPHLRGKRLMLFLSRIHEKKGCDLLLKAFAKVADSEPDLHLVIAGPDQTGWVSDLKLLASRLQISERITWTGMLKGDEKWGAYYSAHLFCLPSHQENFGIVVAESLACGTPVLISNKVNIWREVQADNAGFIGDDSVAGTIKSLQSWLDMSFEERSAMRHAAQRCFESRFRIDKVAESLINILEDSRIT